MLCLFARSSDLSTWLEEADRLPAFGNGDDRMRLWLGLSDLLSEDPYSTFHISLSFRTVGAIQAFCMSIQLNIHYYFEYRIALSTIRASVPPWHMLRPFYSFVSLDSEVKSEEDVWTSADIEKWS